MEARIELHTLSSFDNAFGPEVLHPEHLLFIRIYIGDMGTELDYMDVVPRDGYLEVRNSTPLITNMPSSNVMEIRPKGY